jgi:hypothetical protein
VGSGVQADSSVAGKAIIILKNLQNCVSAMPEGTGRAGLRHARQSQGIVVGFSSRDRESSRHSCVMENGVKHKYAVGETVYFTASNVARPAASGTYEVIRLLPTDGDDCQYRIKNSTEAFERVAKESQLDIS